MGFAINVKRNIAQVTMHVSGCASVDHARSWKMRMESDDYSLPNPARNNFWIVFESTIGRQRAHEIAELAGPLLFPSKTQRSRTWNVNPHTCM